MSSEGTLVYVADSIPFSLSLLFIVFKVTVLLLWVVLLNVKITENLEIKKKTMMQPVLNVQWRD